MIKEIIKEHMILSKNYKNNFLMITYIKKQHGLDYIVKFYYKALE